MIAYWHHDVLRLSVCNAVYCGIEWVYRAKCCTSVFQAGNFLFAYSDTFAVGCIV